MRGAGRLRERHEASARRGRVALKGAEGQALLGRGLRRGAGHGRKVAGWPAGPEGGPGGRRDGTSQPPGGRTGFVAPRGGLGGEADPFQPGRSREGARTGRRGLRGWDSRLLEPETPRTGGARGVGTRSGPPPRWDRGWDAVWQPYLALCPICPNRPSSQRVKTEWGEAVDSPPPAGTPCSYCSRVYRLGRSGQMGQTGK